MSPTILALTTAAVVAAAGITIKVIHGTEPEKKSTNVAALASASAHEKPTIEEARVKPPTDPTETTRVIAISKRDGDQDVVMRSVVLLDRVGVCALQADDDIFRSMGVEPSAIQNICRNLAGAEEVKNCTPSMQDAKVKVCIMKDGNTDEVVFMDRPGPLPVMFTSSTGKGRLLSNASLQRVDHNSLVPVAARGCGENVVMWFHPSEEFLFAMPDSLKSELESVITIDQDISITQDSGGIKITRRMRNADGTTTETVEKLSTPSMKINIDRDHIDSVLKHAMSTTKDAFRRIEVEVNTQMKDIEFNLDSLMRMKHFKFDLDSLMKLKDLKYDLDSMLKDVEIKFEKNINEIEDQEVLMWNDDQAQVHRIEVVRAPHIRSRIIVLSSRRTSPDTEIPLTKGSLQETRTSAGSIMTTSVYPNPVTDGGATLRFELSEPRNVTLQLLDLAGDVVREPQKNIQRGPGQWQFAIEMNDLAPGMYLLSLTTDAGERAVQRLIVQ
jgi:hypothetical protein